MKLRFLYAYMKSPWGLLHNNRAQCRVTEKKIFKFAGAWTLTESRALSVMMSFTLDRLGQALDPFFAVRPPVGPPLKAYISQSRSPGGDAP